MENVNVIYEAREGRGFVKEWEHSDPAEVYKDLAAELIAKKINNCKWIRSIKRRQLYNGYLEITVNYPHGGRRIYTVKMGAGI